MKYEVIARRYRPRRFEDVVGQESFAQTLRGAILQNRLAHAYLFAGPRGVGKTSMARIFAKALNCPAAADRSRPEEEWAQPCDACSICRSIHLGQDIDVIEIDGASHRGIEEVRSLIEGVSRPATRSPYKVYIIDEVHMLTREAFNALLKTLEEPPGHVKFVFATTEPHKIPDTVLSRCQRFDFSPIQTDAIVRRLERICKEEGVEAEAALLQKVARCGKGGLRDAQTLLDQLITCGNRPLREEDLDRVTGRVSEASIGAITSGILDRDSRQVLVAVRGAFDRGADPAVLLEQVIEAFHVRLGELVRACGPERPSVPGAGVNPETASSAQDASAARLDTVVGCLQVLLETATRLRSAAFPELAVEVALVKLSRLEDPRALERALAQLEAMDRTAPPRTALPSSASRPAASSGRPRELEMPFLRAAPPASSAAVHAPAVLQGAGAAAPSVAASVAPAATAVLMPPAAACDSIAEADEVAEDALAASPSTPEEGPPTASTAGSAPCDPVRLRALWDQISIEMRTKHPEIAAYLTDGRLADSTRALDGPREGERWFTVTFSNDFYLRQMKLPRRQQLLEELVREVTREPWRLRLELRAERGAGSGEGERSASREPPPPAPKAGGEGRRSLADDPLVRKSIEIFNGRLV
jgi:DNA polymerase-3 subunit gamma/tau